MKYRTLAMIAGVIVLALNVWAVRQVQSLAQPEQYEATPTPETTAPEPTPEVQAGRVSYGLIGLVNEQRTAAGVPALIELTALDAGAVQRAGYLVRTGQWSHAGMNDQMRAALGYPTHGHGGENLARGFTSEPEIISSWLASPTHRAVMLDSAYIYAGAGQVNGTYVLWLSTRFY